MSDQMILWRGSSSLASPIMRELLPVLVSQKRFFLVGEVLVSNYGIVGMLLGDGKPESRKASYSDGDWIGVSVDHMEGTFPDDPIREAHYANTQNGFSVIRVIVLPPRVESFFRTDEFLGRPMIEKCACQGVFETEFDEEFGSPSFLPIADALSCIQGIAAAALSNAGVQGGGNDGSVYSWISFHSWVVFESVKDEARIALERSLGNFDGFIEKTGSRIERLHIGNS